LSRWEKASPATPATTANPSGLRAAFPPRDADLPAARPGIAPRKALIAFCGPLCGVDRRRRIDGTLRACPVRRARPLPGPLPARALGRRECGAVERLKRPDERVCVGMGTSVEIASAAPAYPIPAPADPRCQRSDAKIRGKPKRRTDELRR